MKSSWSWSDIIVGPGIFATTNASFKAVCQLVDSFPITGSQGAQTI